MTAFDEDAALDRFRTLLRVPTMSRNAVEETDWAAFDRFVELLPELYPALHAVLERELHGHSMLYRWPGADRRRRRPHRAHGALRRRAGDGRRLAASRRSVPS